MEVMARLAIIQSSVSALTVQAGMCRAIQSHTVYDMPGSSSDRQLKCCGYIMQ